MGTVRKQTLDFYINSRDEWKGKNKKNKIFIKYLKIKIRDLEKSRDYWKGRAINGNGKKNDSITNPDPNIMEGGLVSKPPASADL